MTHHQPIDLTVTADVLLVPAGGRLGNGTPTGQPVVVVQDGETVVIVPLPLARRMGAKAWSAVSAGDDVSLSDLVAALPAQRSIEEVCTVDGINAVLRGRILLALRREGMHTVGDLAGRSEEDLLDLRGFGNTCLSALKNMLAAAGAHADAEPGREGER